MATPTNLDHQIFWAPRPLSRPQRAEGQSHSLPTESQPKSSPLPPIDDRSVLGILKEPLGPSPRPASGRDDVIYIFDDAASDMNDASDARSIETLLAVEAILQCQEEVGKIGRTVDGCDPKSQHKNEHSATGQWASSTPPEHEQINDSSGPSADLAADCLRGDSAPRSRMRTCTLTSMTARSRAGSPSCVSSLWDAAPPQTRCNSMSADDEGTKDLATPDQLHDSDGVGIVRKGSLDPSQTPSGKGDYTSDDAASDKGVAVCDEPLDKMLPSGQVIVPSLGKCRNTGTTVDHCEQTFDSKDIRSSSTSPDDRRVNHSAKLSFNEPADCPTAVPSSTSGIRAPTPSMPASARSNSSSFESQPWDTVSTHTSRTSISTSSEGTDETDNQQCTEIHPPEKSGHESSASECNKNTSVQPLMSRVHRNLQNKRAKESLVSQHSEHTETKGLAAASDDQQYCPSTSDELKGDCDRQSGDEGLPTRKRRRVRTMPRITKSPSQESSYFESAESHQALAPMSSATSEGIHDIAAPADAAFDEWVLQDVVLKRTILGGKATFLFQFDWDLCMKHGDETGRREGSIQQGRGRPSLQSSKRRCRKPRNETKGRRCGLCGQPGHNARTCQSGIEISDEDGNV